MSATLPGSIPGLLRRGSPVLDNGSPAVVARLWMAGGALFSIRTERNERADTRIENFALDLSDPTGRAHAAVWAMRTRGMGVGGVGLSSAEVLAVQAAVWHTDMLAAQIETLRLLVLRLAGVTP